jgi:transcriptional regulator with XRE-family HTH domain
MKLTLAENIRAFRKERRLTQDQLAEALGVTVGSVYKWESGQSVPELNMMVEIADFFDTSMDALLGYRMKDNSVAAVGQRLSEYCRVRNPEALAEAEKALKKHPNSFEVVHGCARVYAFFGVGSKDHSETRRALELFEQARRLISQNHDPEISEQTIIGEIAGAYILLEEREKSVELLKSNNAGGLFSDAIGLMLALNQKKTDEAEPFLAKAMLQNTIGLVQSVAGHAIVLSSRGDTASARKLLSGVIDFLSPLKEGEKADFADKLMVMLLALMAHIYSLEGETEQARAYLNKASIGVRLFDAAPDYGIQSLSYPAFRHEVILTDSFGATAADSVEALLNMLGNQTLTQTWKEIISNDQ